MKTLWPALLIIFSLGCVPVRKPGPLDLSQPGWRTWQAEAVWRPSQNAPELTGELLIAKRGSSETFVSFSKTLPILTAQTMTNGWFLNAIPEKKEFGAPGKPPARIVWFQIVAAIEKCAVSKPWKSEAGSNGSLVIQNEKSGERLEIFFER